MMRGHERRGARVVTGIVVLIACGCTGEPARDADATPTFQPPADVLPQVPGASADERLRNYTDGALALESTTRAGMRERLGPPDSTRSDPTANRHIAGQTDTIVTVYYPGLAVELYRVTAGTELIQRVDVEDNRWLRYSPGIGADTDELPITFGAPVERTDSTLAFVCRACSPVAEPITFHFANGRVRWIRFAYYVD